MVALKDIYNDSTENLIYSYHATVGMGKLDPQEERTLKALIRNPRLSDNSVARLTGVPVMTVNRKRKKMEEEGILRYYAVVNMGPEGTGRFGARHLYLIKFKLGLSQDELLGKVMEEPRLRTVFTEFIHESHIAEIDGHTSLALIMEGKDDDEINIVFNSRVIPSLKQNHGEDSIVQVSTMRLGRTIRLFHNYLPMVNMKGIEIAKEWGDEAIFVA